MVKLVKKRGKPSPRSHFVAHYCQNLNDILDKFSEFTSLKIILSFSDLQDNTVLSENAAISLLNVDELILPYDSSYAEVSYNTFYIDKNNVRLQKVIFPAQIIFISKKFITTSEDMVFGFEVIFDNNTGWYLLS